MYLTVSCRPGPWKCLNHAVTANNLSFGRLDKSNDDAQINHFCLRSRIHNFFSNFSLPKLSDMSSIWLLLLPLHSPDTILKVPFSLDFTAPSSPALLRPPWSSNFSLLFCGFLSLSSLPCWADLYIINPSVFPPLSSKSASQFLSQTLQMLFPTDTPA